MYTLTQEEAKYVVFENGTINADLINECQSTSENFTALKTLVNSDIVYSFDISTTFVNSDGNESSFVANKGDGTVGITYTPGHPEAPSIDGNVHILCSAYLSEEDLVQNVAHEGYGHGFLYELYRRGGVIYPFHQYNDEWDVVKVSDSSGGFEDYEFQKKDNNLELQKHLNIVTKQALKNYRSRNER